MQRERRCHVRFSALLPEGSGNKPTKDEGIFGDIKLNKNCKKYIYTQFFCVILFLYAFINNLFDLKFSLAGGFRTNADDRRDIALPVNARARWPGKLASVRPNSHNLI